MTDRDKKAYLLMERYDYSTKLMETQSVEEWNYLRDCLQDIDIAIAELESMEGL